MLPRRRGRPRQWSRWNRPPPTPPTCSTSPNSWPGAWASASPPPRQGPRRRPPARGPGPWPARSRTAALALALQRYQKRHNAWRCAPKTTRSATTRSKAPSPQASTGPAPCSCGTAALGAGGRPARGPGRRQAGLCAARRKDAGPVGAAPRGRTAWPTLLPHRPARPPCPGRWHRSWPRWLTAGATTGRPACPGWLDGEIGAMGKDGVPRLPLRRLVTEWPGPAPTAPAGAPRAAQGRAR